VWRPKLIAQFHESFRLEFDVIHYVPEVSLRKFAIETPDECYTFLTCKVVVPDFL
jgi:hypothetical protein